MRSLTPLALLFTMSSCLPRASEGDAATHDPPDAPQLDASPLDTPSADTPSVDTPSVDTPQLDAPQLDASPLDASPLDASPLDASPLDTPQLDAPSTDAPTLDVRDATTETASDASGDSTHDALAPDVATSPGIAAPRPIAPHLSTRVASGRPTFEWALPSGVDGARLELCRDRACVMIVSSVDAAGSTYTPPTALAAGHYYWRLGGVRAGVYGVARSASRSLFLGGTSTDDAAGLGISRDLNGDGFSDMLVRWPATGVDALLGRPTGRPTVQRTFTSDVPLAIVGDVNGDGFADALSSASLYLGSREGLPAEPLRALPAPTAEGVLWTGAAGDVNGDGLADVLRITPSRIELYLGGRAGLSMTPQVITAPTGTHRACAAVGDVNGDGFADIALSRVAGVVGSETGTVYLFTGASTGLSATPTSMLASLDAFPTFGHRVGAVGDFDGDGFADVTVTDADPSRFFRSPSYHVYLFRGGSGGLSTTPANTWLLRSSFVHALASAGDIDRDGFADIAVGATDSAQDSAGTTGYSLVYYGVDGASTPRSLGPYLDGWTTVLYPASITTAGDLNGDGFSDLILGTGGYRSMTAAVSGNVYIFVGSRAGIMLPPFATWGALGVPFDSTTREYPVIVSDRRRPLSPRHAPIHTPS